MGSNRFWYLHILHNIQLGVSMSNSSNMYHFGGEVKTFEFFSSVFLKHEVFFLMSSIEVALTVYHILLFVTRFTIKQAYIKFCFNLYLHLLWSVCPKQAQFRQCLYMPRQTFSWSLPFRTEKAGRLVFGKQLLVLQCSRSSFHIVLSA